MFIKENLNPHRWQVGDCVIRAISKTFNQPWLQTYDEICELGREMYDMPSSNAVWQAYLKQNGYKRYGISNTCPNCYTIRDFCEDHPDGRYILGTGSHVVAVVDGDFFDTWDSGFEVPIYYFIHESEV